MLLNDRLNKEALVGKEGGGETQLMRECNKKQIQITPERRSDTSGNRILSFSPEQVIQQHNVNNAGLNANLFQQNPHRATE